MVWCSVTAVLRSGIIQTVVSPSSNALLGLTMMKTDMNVSVSVTSYAVIMRLN